MLKNYEASEKNLKFKYVPFSVSSLKKFYSSLSLNSFC